MSTSFSRLRARPLQGLMMGVAAIGLTATGHAATPELPHAWKTASANGLCAIGKPPSEDMPYLLMLSSAGDGIVMMAFTAPPPRLPQLRPGTDYHASITLDGKTLTSPALVYRDEATQLYSIGMAVAVSDLESLARSERIAIRLDGRRLVDIAPAGRPEAVKALQTCLKSLPAPQTAVAQKAGPSALDAAEAAANRAMGASGGNTGSSRPARANASPLDAADAAAQKAMNAQGGQNRGSQNPSQTAATAAANAMAMQAKSDELLFMMRMNNHLIAGGSMGDPHMGAVTSGLMMPGY